jgi:trigger factor
LKYGYSYKENIGLLNEKITLKLEKTDYLPTFEKSLKDHSKKPTFPGSEKEWCLLV